MPGEVRAPGPRPGEAPRARKTGPGPDVGAQPGSHPGSPSAPGPAAEADDPALAKWLNRGLQLQRSHSLNRTIRSLNPFKVGRSTEPTACAWRRPGWQNAGPYWC